MWTSYDVDLDRRPVIHPIMMIAAIGLARLTQHP
jgi:hypothetical protein